MNLPINVLWHAKEYVARGSRSPQQDPIDGHANRPGARQSEYERSVDFRLVSSREEYPLRH